MILFHSAVYLYGEAATEDHRKTVPQIRLGEYEGLPEKVRNFLHILSNCQGSTFRSNGFQNFAFLHIDDIQI